MFLKIYCVLFLITGFSSKFSNGEQDLKGIKSESDEKLVNLLDSSVDDRHKRSYESEGYQSGLNQVDQQYNNGYPPPSNYYNFGRSGENGFPAGPPNQYPQPPLDRVNQNQNSGKSPLEDVVGKALETVLVQSVRHLLNMTPLGGGQGDFMRSSRETKPDDDSKILDKIENLEQIDNHKMQKREIKDKENESIQQPEFMTQQIQQQNSMKEIRRQNRMRQLAFQQSMMKNKENIENQKRFDLMNQQRDSDKYWQHDYNNKKREQQTDFSKYQYDQRNANQNREKQKDAKFTQNRQRNQRQRDYTGFSQQLKEDYPMNWQQQQDPYKYNRQRQYATKNNEQSRNERYFQKEKEDFMNKRRRSDNMNVKESDYMDYERMKDIRQRDAWAQQIRTQNRVMQQGMRENDMMKMNENMMMQKNRIKKLGPEQQDVMQQQQKWQQFQQQQQPLQQQFFMGDWQQDSSRNIMSQQNAKSSDIIPGIDQTTKERTFTNEPFDSSSSPQEVLLQPPTVIKRYVTYSNRFKPPPVPESVFEQEMSSEDASPKRDSNRKTFSDDGIPSSTEQIEMPKNQVEQRTREKRIGKNIELNE